KAIQLINEANPGEGFLTIRSLDAFEKAADGQATKIIIPSEIQGIAGLAKTVTETIKDH
ncbi:MAG TPA: peptidase, partial [Ruminococcaceae bacterium]|nr:peptidase [Oscillospiraceae bacterium]